MPISRVTLSAIGPLTGVVDLQPRNLPSNIVRLTIEITRQATANPTTVWPSTVPVIVYVQVKDTPTGAWRSAVLGQFEGGLALNPTGAEISTSTLSMNITAPNGTSQARGWLAVVGSITAEITAIVETV
jgi:hypothetical protein